ncbi:MAG: glycoside hydrolase family 55 protein [Verrucomicrobia bacterium]|nr:glycoside hydrolase family 55 protein [Verrucomicrobiota bacterium]
MNYPHVARDFGGDNKRIPLLHFRHNQHDPHEDANNCTFFSALQDVTLRILPGNKGATGIRFRVAQHSFIRRVRFELNDAYAGVDQAGNLIEGCYFAGGQHAITTLRTSASWPLSVLDCTFEGQSVSAISSARAGMTVVRSRFRQVPVASNRAVEAKDEPEQLCFLNCSFADVSQCVIDFPNAKEDCNHCILQDCTIENCHWLVRQVAPLPALKTAGTDMHMVSVRLGLCLQGVNGSARITQPPAPTFGDPCTESVSLLPDYPDISILSCTVDARDHGVAGDGDTDDTQALQSALDTGQLVFLPPGTYRLSDTLKLQQTGGLMGLHPARTTLKLPCKTPGFTDPENPRPVLYAPLGADCHCSGIGLDIEDNPGAIGLEWRGSMRSSVEDVYFNSNLGKRNPAAMQSGSSLLIHDGGGGVFRNIWTADVLADRGLVIKDTDTRTVIYQMSVEHHRELEIECIRARNVVFIALQTEENRLAPETYALRLSECHNMRLFNPFFYRVMSLTNDMPYAVLQQACTNMEFAGFYCFSWGDRPFKTLLAHQSDACNAIQTGACWRW